jgi:hypothetical protein
MPRETTGWLAHRQQLGYRQGQLASQDWQPALLLLNARNIVLSAGQPDQHLLPEAEGHVVPPTGADGPDRQE